MFQEDAKIQTQARGCTGVFLESQVERRKGREAEESGGLTDHLMIAKLFEGGKGGIKAWCWIIAR